LTFEGTNEDEDEDEDEDEIIDLAELPLSEIEPSFGNIHPLEGLRSVLYEEASAVFIAIKPFALSTISVRWLENFPVLSRRYRIPYLSQVGVEESSQLLSPSLQCRVSSGTRNGRRG